MALDPTTQHSGIDLAAVAGDFLEGVLQRATICPLLVHAPDKVSYAPILGLHDCGSGLQEGRQLLPFRFLVLGPLDASGGVTQIGNPLASNPKDGLSDEVVPPLKGGQPVRGRARLAGSYEPPQEDERGSDKPLAVFMAETLSGSILNVRRSGASVLASMRAVRMRR